MQFVKNRLFSSLIMKNLYVALAMHSIGEGVELIFSSFILIATANATLFVGTKPVFTETESYQD